MRRSVAVVATVAIAVSGSLAGCRFSKVDPQATVTVSGRAFDAAGKPLADTTVRLFPEADVGQLLLGTVLALGSLGSICLLPDAPAICAKGRTARTDAAGRYSFSLRGSDTQGTIGTEATLDVVVAAPDPAGRGAATTVRFPVRDTTVRLPDARLWRAAPHVTEGSGRIGMTFARLPSAAGSRPTYAAQLFAARGGAELWTQPASGSRATIDARVLEDVDGTAAVSARTTLPRGTGTGTVTASYLSERVAVRPVAGAPPSRGRPCSAVSGTTALSATPQRTCGATDGDLAAPARLQGAGSGAGSATSGAAGVVTGVVVDLGTARRVDLVVARGMSGQVLVEVSADGRSFRTVGTSEGSPVAIPLPGGPTARYVRVRTPGGVDESLLGEVSVW